MTKATLAGALLLAAACALATWRWAAVRLAPPPMVVVPPPGTVPPYRVDLNRAPWFEISALPDVGEVRARAIVAYREAHGPFHSPDGILSVAGIGPVTLEAVRPWVVTGEAGR